MREISLFASPVTDDANKNYLPHRGDDASGGVLFFPHFSFRHTAVPVFMHSKYDTTVAFEEKRIKGCNRINHVVVRRS